MLKELNEEVNALEEKARLAKDGTLTCGGLPASEAIALLAMPLELENGCTLRSFFLMLRLSMPNQHQLMIMKIYLYH